MADSIVMASDHRGAALKAALRQRLEAAGHTVVDMGTDGEASVDYPDFAAPAARSVSQGEAPRGILVCGSGLGVMYTANRFAGVRAAWVQDAEMAAASRAHNDSNMIALPGDRLSVDEAWTVVEAWLQTAFEGGRHASRVEKIDSLTLGPRAAAEQALANFDPDIARLIHHEAKRQALGLELIASENFVSEPVLAAVGSVLTNKYAEGYPGRRYYGGCEVVDEVEQFAIDRAKALFGAEYANVQPHAGSQANEAVYRAVCEVGDTVLAMNLDHGGHLTHGSPVNFSGKLYNIVPYGVRKDTEQIDYDQVRQLAKEHRPRMIQCGTTAYSRIIDFAAFREIADEVDAVLFADIAHIAGLVASGLHPTPVGLAHIVTSTTHKTLRGPRGGLILADQVWGKKLNSAVFPGGQGGPLMHVIAGKAVAFKEAATPEFKAYSQAVLENAKTLADELQKAGFNIVSGGTDTHLFLLSLVGQEISGKQAEATLGHAGITTNKNMVPFDPRKPAVTSGIRLGTPAVTTRGMRSDDMKEVAALIVRALGHPDDEAALFGVRADVEALCRRFPLYPGRWTG